MPDRYFTKRLQMDSNHYLTMVFLDTSPCVSDYRSTNPANWDPCSTKYPTCSLTDSNNDDFEGPCKFHENIISQSCEAQYHWLQNTLQSIPKNDWLVVVGHHPIDECDVEDLTALIQQHGFALYLNGHTHTLAQYTIDHAGAYITTGAGAMVNTTDQAHPMTQRKLAGLNITRDDLQAMNKATGVNAHTYQSVYKNTVAGFTLHTFNSDFTTLTNQFVTYTGAVVRSFVVNKDGVIIG